MYFAAFFSHGEKHGKSRVNAISKAKGHFLLAFDLMTKKALGLPTLVQNYNEWMS